MMRFRSIMLWALAAVLLLGAFAFFVANGWPGTPHRCTTTTPNSCYCEAFDTEQLRRGAPGVRQPVNTWSNLYALLSSFVIALCIYSDRRRYASSQAPNLLRSTSFVPELYLFCVLFLGLGSMWFHASLTAWGGILDGASMYTFVSFLVFYSIRRFYPSAVFFWTGYGLTVLLFTWLHSLLPAVVNISILTGAYLVIEVYLWVRGGRIMQGRTATRVLWILAVSLMLAASFFWWASQTGNFLCDPGSLLQPHGLLWHPLAGIVAVLLYFYWRAANDPPGSSASK